MTEELVTPLTADILHDDDLDSATAIEDEEVSREQLEVIKARTMYNMVEPIEWC